MKNITVAITGGIGSGKSTVANLIRKLGYVVYSCDEICKDLYKSQRVLRGLKKLFPTAISGTIFLTPDKKKISALTFSDDENYNKLSSYLQPLIVKKLYKLMAKTKGVCFAEVPLLFEGNYQKDFDKVIVVLRNFSSRAESVKIRSGLSLEETTLISKRQVVHENLDLSSYLVINNDGDLESLELKVKEVIKTILSKK